MAKILLAEHDEFLIKVYANQIRKMGHSLTIATDGDLAISKARNIEPDLLVLDISLPKINSFKILKTIKHDPGLKKTKVIILSNFNQEDDIKESFELGAIKHFKKEESTAEDIAHGIKTLLS